MLNKPKTGNKGDGSSYELENLRSLALDPGESANTQADLLRELAKGSVV